MLGNTFPAAEDSFPDHAIACLTEIGQALGRRSD